MSKNNLIDWQKVKRVLVIRLRSIGDTVLTTPSLIALKRFLPNAEIDILLDDWVAPLLTDFGVNVVITGKNKLQTAFRLGKKNYDVVFNFHGGTTSGFFTIMSRVKHRVGYSHYRYPFLYNHLLSSSADFWGREKTHSAEQQLALLGFVGVPVADRPKSKLVVSEKVKIDDLPKKFALFHPVAAFDTKQWATENFARVADFLQTKGLTTIAVGTEKERMVLENLRQTAQTPIRIYDNLSLPETVYLASKAEIFVGNDSGIAHIAGAVETPLAVIFGSSNIHHWSPWTKASHRVIFEKLPCQPCAGYVCHEFEKPKCILSVEAETVIQAVSQLLRENESRKI